MGNVIPFAKRELAEPQTEHLELFDDIDTSKGKPIRHIRKDGRRIVGR
jgi:hypothetical protein